MKVILNNATANEFRSSLVALYQLKLERLQDEASQRPRQTNRQLRQTNRLVANEKAKLLSFLIKELEEMEINKS